jgi:potassium/chloride transporter 9
VHSSQNSDYSYAQPVESPPSHENTLTGSFFHSYSHNGRPRRRSISGRRRPQDQSAQVGDDSLAAQPEAAENIKKGETLVHKPGLGPRPVGGDEKLGMYSGVYVPTCLNVLSILMFLRFGFILGQGGVYGIMGMLVASYVINLITTFSLSAIASNGTVRGGGAYYLISRSLGPEFGGSIGVQTLGTGLTYFHRASGTPTSGQRLCLLYVLPSALQALPYLLEPAMDCSSYC